MRNGFAMAGALVILVVCAVFSLYVLKMSTLASESAAHDSIGEFAYQAARSGAELAAYQSIRNNSCASTTLTFAGLTNYTVSLNCSRSIVSESGVALTVDSWTIVACNSAVCPNVATAGYTERQIKIVIAK